MSSTQLSNTIMMGGAFIALFGAAEYLHRIRKVRPELTRKFVHLFTGLLCLSFPFLIKDSLMVGLLCSSFLILLKVSKQFKFLPSINKVNRKTIGSELYPISVFASYLCYEHFNQLIFFFLPILILAICDPLAGLIGKKINKGAYSIGSNYKTIIGSLAFLISSFLSSGFLLYYIADFSVLFSLKVAILIAFSSTLAEAISNKGFDNLFIPLAVIVILSLYGNQTIA